jgi:hypothetical protein
MTSDADRDIRHSGFVISLSFVIKISSFAPWKSSSETPPCVEG